MRARSIRGALAPLEKAIQTAIIDHWRALGVSDTLVAAIPNAGAMGQPGLTCGLPDLLVIGPEVPGHLAFIELKRDSRSRLSNAQIRFKGLCEQFGVRCATAVGRDEPIRILERWGVVRRQAA